MLGESRRRAVVCGTLNPSRTCSSAHKGEKHMLMAGTAFALFALSAFSCEMTRAAAAFGAVASFLITHGAWSPEQTHEIKIGPLLNTGP